MLRFAPLLAGAAGLFAAAACAADVPLEKFARHAQYEDAKLSPDGQYLAAVAVVHGKRMLSLIHLTDYQGVNVAPRGDDELADFLWAGPHRVVYSVGTRLGGNERPSAANRRLRRSTAISESIPISSNPCPVSSGCPASNPRSCATCVPRKSLSISRASA